MACSPRHRQCSPAHADLVDAYRVTRAVAVLQLELVTNGHAGDVRVWRENGGRLPVFRDFLVKR